MTDLSLPPGITALDGALPGISVDTPAASGVVYSNGAHVAQWTPAGQRPVLWLSKASCFEAGRAIRGGVPLIWPWFGNGPGGDLKPSHGFARVAKWRLSYAKVSPTGTATIQLSLDGGELPDELIGDQPRDFRLEYNISMGQILTLQLVVQAGAEDLRFEEGLHTYLAVSEIGKVHIEGLDGDAYSDRLTGRTATQSGNVTFEGETDRVYESKSAVHLVDEPWGRTILVEKVNSKHTVVWNPWLEKSARLPDLGNDEWPGMVCIEACNTREQSITLAAGERHLFSQTISVR